MSTNTIRIKRRATGNAGAPATLKNAELAFNEVDNTLYYGKGTNAGDATTIISIGGDGAFVTRDTAQTITGNKTFNGSVSVPTVATIDNSTAAASTAFVKAQGYLTGNQAITYTGDATGSGSTAVTLTLANVGTAGTYTKVTTDAKGRVTSGASLLATDIPTLTSGKISDFDTQVRTNRLDQLAAPTASVSLNSRNITNLLDPVNAQDAATKAYVDASRSGLDVKNSVRVATTANITLSGLQTIDGVVLGTGDRVLVKNQTTASANGIYTATSGAWVRTNDADTSAEVTRGMFTFVEEGTIGASTGWVLGGAGPVTVGTTALSFVQFSGAGAITAGSGLTQTGTTFNVGSGTGISVDADTVGLTGQALNLHNLNTGGFFVRTGAGSIASRTVTVSGDGLYIINGDGNAGNPQLSLSYSLSSLSGIPDVSVNGSLLYVQNNEWATSVTTSYGRSILASADAPAARTTLGLGTMSTQNAASVAITGGTIAGITFDGGSF
jgi:phage-related tail fiber protein